MTHRQNLLATALLVSGALLSGCRWDQRKDIAFAILFQDGRPNLDVVERALSARFPAGSPVDTLQRFADRFGGSCDGRESGKLHCEIPTQGEFCAAALIGINAAVQDGVILSLTVEGGGLGC